MKSAKMWLPWPARPLCLLAVLMVSTSAYRPAFSQETLGEFRFEGLLLEPSLIYEEGSEGEFGLRNSYFSIRWSQSEILTAQFKVGTEDLLGVPVRYRSGEPVGRNDLSLVEAYAQAAVSGLGRVRLGLVPLPFGLEGGDREPELMLPRRNLLLSEGWVGLRDVGLSYHLLYRGFFSDWAIHNGEGGANVDNNTWFTARLGWQGLRFLRVGASGVTGRTTPESTNTEGSGDSDRAGLDVTRAARIRLANFFVEWRPFPVSVLLEATTGETRQGEDVRRLRASHVDLEWSVRPSWSTLARFDYLEPQTDRSGDGVQEFTFGLAFRSRYRNSVFYVLGTKSARQSENADVHRAELIWRLTPTPNEIFSTL